MMSRSEMLSFVVGALFGSAAAILATKQYFETKANNRADEEIESMREVLQKRKEEIETIRNDEIEKRAYEIITERYKKSDDRQISEKKKEGEKTEMETRPYVIDPNEVGDTDYPLETLNYYADGVLTYENDEVIENVDELVGKESLTTFGQFEEDTVYVRNDQLQKDFEILADYRKYSEIYC